MTHDAEFVAAEWERVKNTLEPQGYVIVGGIWDNTPVNKAAWKTLASKYPDRVSNTFAEGVN